jgi:hypothetical protein
MSKNTSESGDLPVHSTLEVAAAAAQPAFPSPHPFDYVISGLTVRSEVEIPSAIASVAHRQTPQVSIRAAALPLHLENPLRTFGQVEVDDRQLLMHINRIARFLIRDGSEILFEAEDGHDPGDLTLYLLGTCFAVLLQQRGCVVLHASAVSVDGRAMLFCGQSGAGKSTLAAMLCERGFPLLNDDVCSLRPEPGGGFSVTPDGRMLKLWEPSVQHLELTDRRGPAVRGNTEKYYMAPPVADRVAQRVGGVYILEDAEPGESVSLRRLSVVDGMAELKRNSYRPSLVWAMQMEATYFRATAALQSDASLYALRRPKDFAGAGKVLEMLESHWKSSRP